VITLKKLAGLKPSTRLRKCGYLFREAGIAVLAEGITAEKRNYLIGVLSIAAEAIADQNDPPNLTNRSVPMQQTNERARDLIRFFSEKIELLRNQPVQELAWTCDDVYYRIMIYLGTTAADWDLPLRRIQGPVQDGLSPEARFRQIYPVRPYLDHVRSPFNVGAVFRTAESFCCDSVLLSPETADPSHPRARRTAMGADSSIAWEQTDVSALKARGPIFALESGGIPIHQFAFPHTGTVIVGSEEMGVSPEALRLADGDLGRVTIPLYGSKGSLNLAVAFGILMHQWIRAIIGT
jgi:RNA methyltransferase, TrmH family